MDELIDFLNKEETRYLNKQEQLRILKLEATYLTSIINNLNISSNYLELYNKNIMITETLKLVYNNEDSKNMGDLILDILSVLKVCQTKRNIDPVFYEKQKQNFVAVEKILKNKLSNINSEKESLEKQNVDKNIHNINKLKNLLQNKAIISKDLVDEIIPLLDNRYESKQVIIMLEYIDQHNHSIKNMSDSIPKSDVIEMLSYEFKPYNFNTLDYDSNSIYKNNWYQISSMLLNNHFDEVRELINTFNVDKKIMENILISILNYYHQQIQDLIECVVDKDFYFDEETKKETIETYQDIIKKYLTIEKQLTSLIKDNIVEDTKRKIAYLVLGNSDDSYLEKDLRDMPDEYLGEAFDLFNEFINNNDGRVVTESINGAKGLFKIKNHNPRSQIRFAFAYLENNVHLIIGGFIKKKNVDKGVYANISGRYRINSQYIIDDNDEIYERIKNYVEENKRIGTRK